MARTSAFILDFSFVKKFVPMEKRLSAAALVSGHNDINSASITRFSFIEYVHF